MGTGLEGDGPEAIREGSPNEKAARCGGLDGRGSRFILAAHSNYQPTDGSRHALLELLVAG
jgi:hypothetical protein